MHGVPEPERALWQVWGVELDGLALGGLPSSGGAPRERPDIRTSS